MKFFVSIVCLIVAAFADPSKTIVGNAVATPSLTNQTIVEIAASNPNFSTLVVALKAAALITTLSGPGPFTVFAPSNAAFAALPAPVLANLLKPANKPLLVSLLTYHVVAGDVVSMFRQNMRPAKLTTVEGEVITVTWEVLPGGYRRNYFYLSYGKRKQPKLRIGFGSVKSIAASNGAVVPITAVLTLPPRPRTIVEIAMATPNLSTLVTALIAADLADTLSSTGPFTVFAPTNEAFAALPPGVLASLLLPHNKAQLVDILTYHVASGAVFSKDITDKEMITTLEGGNVTARIAERSIFINSAKVINADVVASNGVVHIIDSVLEVL